MVDFWTNICLCHSLILEDNPEGGPKLYQVRVSCTAFDPIVRMVCCGATLGNVMQI